MAEAEPLHKGACHCGRVRFRISGEMRAVVACHCGQCRKWSGHYWAAGSAPRDRIAIEGEEHLVWFASSDAARRGFCGSCGASLFWELAGEGRISFAAGALSLPTGLSIARHIFREDAGDYYSPEGPPPAPGPSAPERLAATCLCGAAAFSLPGPAGPITACHCGQCRALSGHYSASFDADEAAVEWTARDQIGEYRTPGGGLRGFCARCGSSLYFRAADGGFSVEAGAVDGPTGARLADHIFVSDKSDYYVLDDGLPQADGWGA